MESVPCLSHVLHQTLFPKSNSLGTLPLQSQFIDQEKSAKNTLKIIFEHFMEDRKQCAIEIGINATVDDSLNEFWAKNPHLKERFSVEKIIYISVFL